MTKIPKDLLREIIRVFKVYALTDDERRAFRPYARDGGMDGTHDHRTTDGLRATVDETLNTPVELWIEPDTQPDNRFLKQLSLRQTWQTMTVAERLRRDYIKPVLMHGDEDFETLWLSSDHIMDAVRRATKKIRSFCFLGVFSIRDDIEPTVMTSWNDKYKTYGIVWNTSTQGEHWVTTLFFPRERRWEYFDSQGSPPSRRLNNKIEDVLGAFDAMVEDVPDEDWELTPIIETEHQHKAYQCGAYALWYIVQRVVKHRSYEDIQSKEVPDKKMIKIRRKYFREAPEEVRRLYDFEE